MIDIYTDGACSQNGTWDGGWAVVIVEDGTEIASFGGHEKETTNNRMEMMAFLGALEYAKKVGYSADSYTIHTDSAYVSNAFAQRWIVNWQKNGWKNAKKEPVKNKDLWEKIIAHNIPKINKVKGHADNKFNNVVDKLAVQWRDATDEDISNT